ncbi:MAG: hypothetical protein AAF802_27460, partial [Planctomycetota bacterium]
SLARRLLHQITTSESSLVTSTTKRSNPMRILMTTPLLALALILVGCDDSIYDEKAEQVRDTTQDYADDVRDAYDETAEGIEDRYESARPALEGQADELSEDLEDRGETIADSIEDAGEQQADNLEEMDDDDDNVNREMK